MKQTLRFAALLLFVMLFQTANAQTKEKAVWKEMYDFHEVMSSTFHPSEEGNLAPLRERSGELVTRAKTWQKATVPAGYNAKLTKEILKRLVKQTQKIDKMVKKNASDAELTKEITAAHDIFHEIMEKCRD